MKYFKLKSDEELIKIAANIEVEANDNRFILTLFLTTKRLVLMHNVNKELEFNTFLASRMVNIPENLEVAFTINLDKINIEYIAGKNIITFKDNDNKLILYSENIKKLIGEYYVKNNGWIKKRIQRNKEK